MTKRKNFEQIFFLRFFIVEIQEFRTKQKDRNLLVPSIEKPSKNQSLQNSETMHSQISRKISIDRVYFFISNKKNYFQKTLATKFASLKVFLIFVS